MKNKDIQPVTTYMMNDGKNVDYHRIIKCEYKKCEEKCVMKIKTGKITKEIKKHKIICEECGDSMGMIYSKNELTMNKIKKIPKRHNTKWQKWEEMELLNEYMRNDYGELARKYKRTYNGIYEKIKEMINPFYYDKHRNGQEKKMEYEINEKEKKILGQILMGYNFDMIRCQDRAKCILEEIIKKYENKNVQIKRIIRPANMLADEWVSYERESYEIERYERDIGFTNFIEDIDEEIKYIKTYIDMDEKIVYKYHRCHTHECKYVQNRMTEKNKNNMKEQIKNSEKRIINDGYKLVKIYECEWKIKLFKLWKSGNLSHISEI